MSNTSIFTGLFIALAVAAILGFFLKQLKVSRITSATWGAAFGIALAVPFVKLGHATFFQRLIKPHEAVDWLPLLAIGLAIATSLTRWPKGRIVGWIIGAAICIAAPLWMLWGTAFIRPATYTMAGLTPIGLWGLGIAAIWLLHSFTTPPDDRYHWGNSLSLILAIVAASVCVGMSGSMTYGALGSAIAVAALGGWIVTGKYASVASALAAALIGLAHAFSELRLDVAILLGFGLLALGLCARSIRLRIPVMVLAIGLLGAGVGIATKDFLAHFSSEQSDDPYDMYR